MFFTKFLPSLICVLIFSPGYSSEVLKNFSRGINVDYSISYEGIPEFNRYENNRLDLIAKYIPKNPGIFEVGGHYGEDSIVFSKQWPEAQITTFEANPNAFEILKIATNPFPNIHGFNLAVSDYNGEIVLHLCQGPNNSSEVEGASSVLESSKYLQYHYQGKDVLVSCVVLDDWRAANQVSYFDFMWLDIEGFELQFLKSSPKILSNVKVIYTETNFQEFRIEMTLYKDLKEFLEASGFMLVAHWYVKDWQGNAIFIKKELFDNINPL